MKVVIQFITFILNFSLLFAQNEEINSKLEHVLEKYQLEYDDNNNYPVFKSIRDTSVQSKINGRVKNIIVDQLKSDTFRIKIDEHVKKSLHATFSLTNNVEDSLDFFKGARFETTLKDTEYRISKSHSTLTLVALFHYTTDINSYHFRDIFRNTYYEVYYFDINNGKEYNSRDIFKQDSKSALNLLLAEKLDERLLFISKGLGVQYDSYFGFQNIANAFPDQYEGEELNHLPSIKETNEFSINKYGIAFPKSFSIEYFVPRWSIESSKLTQEDISIRLSYSEIRQFLNPNGPFRELIKEQDKEITRLNQAKNPPFHYLYNWVTPHNDISIAYQDTINKIKNTTIYRQIKSRHGLRDNAIFQEIFRLENGLIDCIKFYDEQGSSFTEFQFDYDLNKNLLNIWSDGQFSNFQYDKNYNLTYSNRFGDSHEESFYKYHSNYMISESYSYNEFLSANKEITVFKNVNMPLKKYTGRLYFAEINYIYDDKNNLLKESGTYASNGEIWFENNYTYDNQNKILLHTYDKGRDNVSYKYDIYGRLIERTIFQGKEYSIWLKYNDKNLPISIRTNPQINTGFLAFYSLTYDYW